ncbi:hypothetical protein [Algivirga pacifica]|uniref:Uncharacterized protein n=1 Tax=Algivirga pacifica TaxID=1162670 RepID=A0ABP9DLE0_9BACT
MTMIFILIVVVNVKMTRIIDIILAIIVIGGLSLTLLVEIANLIGFGTQEYYLQHPDYPEGSEFKKDLKSGFAQLIFWTIITAGLLTLSIYSRIKKKKGLLNRTALATFIFATYLPILTILNGLTIRGLIMGTVTLGLAGLTLIKMIKEKSIGKNTM